MKRLVWLLVVLLGGCTVELHWHQGERHYVTTVNPAALAGGDSQEVQDDR